MGRFANVGVASFRSVTEEGGVSQGWVWLPMPFPGIPWKVLDEARVENPVKKSFLTWGQGVPGHLERCLGVLLREHFDGLMVDGVDPERLVGRQLDASALEFESHGSVSVLCKDHVYPV
jgi:hypothetical protein